MLLFSTDLKYEERDRIQNRGREERNMRGEEKRKRNVRKRERKDENRRGEGGYKEDDGEERGIKKEKRQKETGLSFHMTAADTLQEVKKREEMLLE